MAISVSKIEEAYSIIKNYDGTNLYVTYLKNLSDKGYRKLSEFDIKYILENYQYAPIKVNKTIKITDWFGKSFADKNDLDFIPEKLLIMSIIGEMGDSYHCYVRYRKSVIEPLLTFVPKKALMDDIFVKDYKTNDIDFTPYNALTAHLNRSLKPHQEEAVKFLITRNKAILADEQGLGKLVDVNTSIPTPHGWRKMGELKIGDKVFGSDGKSHNVIGIFPQGVKDVYEITFSDGVKCNCGLEHLWIVRDSNRRLRKKGWVVKSLKELLDSGLQYNSSKKRVDCGYKPVNKWEIPMCEPVNYSKKEYFIHPYILGMCIGDGSMCSNKIELSIPNFEYESVDRIKKLLNEKYTLSENRNASCPHYYIIQKEKTPINEYNREIKRLGLNVLGKYKFIPEEYMNGSIEQRKELLMGLMDSDGSICKNNKMHYYTTSEKLARDIQMLVYSLGGHAIIHSYDRTNESKSIEYDVKINIKFCPFKIERKKQNYNIKKNNYCSRYIEKVELVRKADAVCIRVDSDDSSYLTENYIVTHNTTSAIVASMAGGYKKVLIICPASLKGTWKRELSYYTNPDNIGIIFGKKWVSDKQYTVINYDILDNFYHIPLEPDYRIETYKDENGKNKKIKVPIMVKCKGKKGKNGEMEPKMKKSRKKEVIKEALSKSQLFLAQFDLVIIDEVQKLANNTSIRYKTLDDFLNRTKPKAIYCITGTPLTNRPLNLYHILKLIDADIAKNYDYYMDRFCDAKTINKSDGTKIKICDGASNLDELREKIKHLYIRRLQKDIPGMVKKTIFTRYYTLTDDEMAEYRKLWQDYLNAQYLTGVDVSKYQELIEGGLVRRYLANKMIENTISLAEEHIEDGEKVLIVCCFENEVKKFKEHFGDMAVVYDGKKTNAQKDKAEYEFMNNPKKKVFIGQILASGVGITLTKSHICIFNSYSWVPSDNWQVMDRVHRLSQTEDVTVYYQLFDDDISLEMWEKVMSKEDIIKAVIKSENEK